MNKITHKLCDLTLQKQLGSRLKNMRKEHKMTLRTLGQLAGISVPQLSNLENGLVNPRYLTLIKIFRVWKSESQPPSELVGFLKKRKIERSPLMDIWGQWPGEESTDEILAALRKTSPDG